MSKCYICDKMLGEVKTDRRDLKPTPCTECEAVIQENLESLDQETTYNYMESELSEYKEEVGTTDSDSGTNLGDP